MPTPYQPLVDFLAAQPPATTTVVLTLAEIEALLGAVLPSSARTAAWWTSARRGQPQGRRPWVVAGWRVAQTSMRTATPTVTFARLG